MATIILGVIGAGIGGLTAGPGGAVKGAMLGWSIGTTLGSFIDQANTHYYTSDMGRTSDLRVTVASYGTSIPLVYGLGRVPGIVVWGTDLVEHETNINSGGGASGGPQVTTRSFTYTVSFAAVVCAGNINNRIDKIYGDDFVIFDRAQAGNTITAILDSGAVQVGEAITSAAFPNVSIRYYFGTETQNADPLIISSAGNTAVPAGSDNPALRGTCYIVFQDMLLTNWGNRIPNLSIKVNTGDTFVSDVVTDISKKVGINTSTQLDVSGVTTNQITGMIVASRVPANSALASIIEGYSIDLIDVDKVVRAVPRGAATVATISWDELSATIISSGDSPPAQRVVASRSETLSLPKSIDLGYFSTTVDLQQATQRALRQSALNNNPQSVSYPLSLNDDEAKQMAERKLYLAWVERIMYSAETMPYYAFLCAADCILLQIDPLGTVLRLRLLEIETGLMGEIRLSKMVRDFYHTYEQIGSGTTPSGGIVTLSVVSTQFFAWSGTELLDQDSASPGFYVAATGAIGWQGASILMSVDGGTTYNLVGSVSSRSVFGTVSNVLGNIYIPNGNGFDVTNTLSVIVNGLLSSTNEASIIGGQGNYGLLLKTNTSVSNIADYEIFGFANASLVSTGHYTVSDLLRSRRMTVGTGHANTDTFVQLTSAIKRVAVANSLIHTVVKIKVVSSGVDPTTVTAQDVYIASPSNIFSTSTSTTAAANAVRTPYWRVRGYLGGNKTNSLDDTYFFDASGSPGSNYPYAEFTIAENNTATGGSYTISVTVNGGAAQTATIPHASSSAAIKTALEALSNTGAGTFNVTGPSAINHDIKVIGSLISSTVVLTSNGSLLTGGTTTGSPSDCTTTVVSVGVLGFFWEEGSLSPIDVSWRYETPGAGYTLYLRINLTNSSGGTITFNWWGPLADHMVRVRLGGTYIDQFFFGTTPYNQKGTASIPAGTTQLLEIFYWNDPATYTAGDAGSVFFKTDALAQGLTWSDAGK